MILPLIGCAIGAVLGLVQAASKGGNRLDMAQWAAVLGLMGGIVGLFVLIFVSRAAV
jgi:hypothetical protein